MLILFLSQVKMIAPLEVYTLSESWPCRQNGSFRFGTWSLGLMVSNSLPSSVFLESFQKKVGP